MAFGSLFSIVDPFGLIPTFLHLTKDYSIVEKRHVIKKAAFFSLVFLTLFAFIGQAVLSYFGVSLAALKITGGILIFLIAFEMIQGKISHVEKSENVENQLSKRQEKLHEIAIVPLTIPLITGPGALSTVVILMAQAEHLVLKLELILAIFLVIISTYCILRIASRLEQRIGKIGINVLTKLMGLILISISVQMLIDGIAMVVNSL
ncbi:MAG: multiple antibiotic resistance protein [Candidatus Woesearchaeota archaeon]|nr:multiple antibiotic resistance protein [Candidatus Woesearchaeota archaeon]MDN5327523.1 multiple antibiotic resistance protein [Candidatus Woesearchaeota archaeon]